MTRMSEPFATTISPSGVAELIMHRPPVNAFDTVSMYALATEIQQLGRNDDVRAIIIGAEGKGFFAGLDMKEMAADGTKILDGNYSNYDVFEAVHRNPKPVIAALHGYVLGGGIGIAGAADILVCADDATFGVPEVDRGGMGMGAHLQRMFPLQKVRYMYFTGEFIDAAEAYRLGAVERVVTTDELLPAAREIAEKIAAKSATMMKIAKRSLNGVEDGSLEDKYRWEQGFTFEAYHYDDSQEARDAFVEKRDAKFEG